MRIEWSQGLGSNPRSAFTLHLAFGVECMHYKPWQFPYNPSTLSINTHSPSSKAVLPRVTLFSFQMCCTIAQLALTTGHAGYFPDFWRSMKLYCLWLIKYRGKNCLSKSYHPISHPMIKPLYFAPREISMGMQEDVASSLRLSTPCSTLITFHRPKKKPPLANSDPVCINKLLWPRT